MGLFSKYKKTNFEAGGLLLPDRPLGARDGLQADAKFVAPRKIDNRDMLLSSSNQGQFPHCAGYTMAGVCEYYHWKRNHYPIQFSGDNIYLKAKEIDGYGGNGTYLRFAVQAANLLNLIKCEGIDLGNSRDNIKFALHEYDVALAGFMITNEWNLVDKKTGRIKDLGSDANTRGGHAVLLCGYDSHGVYIQNSWSEEWGLHGFGLLSWAQFDRQFMKGMAVKVESINPV